MKTTLIRSARVIDPDAGFDAVVDIRFSDVVMEIGALSPLPGETVIDGTGLAATPGLVDLHVHLRDSGIGDGGQSQKEDIFSGCRAAASGGVTSLCCMPNTVPTADSPEIISAIVQKAASADARVYPVAAVSYGLLGEKMTDFAALKAAGAVAVSDDGKPVKTADMMERALREAARVGLLVMAHCEEPSLVRGGIMNLGEVSKQLGVPGIDPAAEDVATTREISLAEKTGCPIHICHVSTAKSADLIRQAKKRGVPVSGETAPHYLLLNDKALLSRNADYRMSPPLRPETDRLALIEALRDGTLTVIATDHAPHSPAEKANFLTAPNGVIGMETSLAAAYTALVLPGYITLPQLIALMSVNPGALLRHPASLAIGSPADLILFDPNEKWTVDREKLHGRSKNTPFHSMELTGRVKLTAVGGKIVYKNISL